MTTLEQFVSPALTRALGWTLLHSLWQGALVAAVLAGALLLLRRQRAEVRYAASASALGMVVALAGITFAVYFTASPAPGALLSPSTVKTQPTMPLKQTDAAKASVSVAAKAIPEASEVAVAAEFLPQASVSIAIPSATPNWLATGLRYFDNHLPLLVVAWLLGLLAMSLRMLGGLLYVQRLRHYRVRPLSAAWQERLAVLAARSGVRRPVALLESALVQVPLVVGHMRPVILLPLGTVAGLSPAYLEAILAHELAHVLRRDYLVNLLQTVAEVLFFYHPAVWFVANCVRTERENCCDDTATALMGGDPLRLARALTALAEWSQSAVVPTAPRLALAAMNRPGALLLRVRRLVQRRPAAPTLAEGLMAGALVLGGLGLLGGSVVLAGPLASNSQGAKPAGQTGPATPTKAAGVADTNKRAARVTPAAPAAPVAPAAPLAPEAAVAPAPPVEEVREVVVERYNDGDHDENGPGDGRSGRRREHRVIVNGRDVSRVPYQGNPGTVVITKDKKGRLTDLVVNGQHVETATGKGKKNKGGKGQQVEVVQVAPFGGADVRSFSFRTDGGELDPLVRREVERNVQSNIKRNVQRNIERDVEGTIQRNSDFQFDFSDFGDQFDKSFRMAPGSSLNRVYRLQSLNNSGSDPESRRATLEALRGAERGLRTAAAAKGLNAEQRKQINKELEKVRAQLKKAESTPATGQLQRLNGGLDTNLDMREYEQQMREFKQQMREHQQEMQEHQREMQERVRESQRELRNMEQSSASQDRDRADRDRDRANRDRDRANRDRERADRDQQFAEHDRERADRDRELADRDRERAERDRKRHEALVDQLQKDGLIQDKDNFQLRLTPNSLTVNGKEQSVKLRDKYLKLHAEANGRPLTGSGSMIINRSGDSNTSFNQSEGPRPPQLPRPPRAPRAPRAPLTPLVAPGPPVPPMLAPPAPPQPPRIDSDELRSELRKDGVLAANEKNLQFQLNASGLTVNGKKQSDALAAKYRKLTGHADGKNFNVMISTQED